MADQAEIGGVAGAGKPRKQKEGVFISYARRDGKHFAGKLRDRLEREGIPCWQDIVGMEGGHDWWMQIQDAINSVEFLVLVMTPAAMQSKTVRKEWRYARQQGVCVYPVIATPPTEFDTLVSALPRWMRDVHFYDLGQDTDHFEHASNWLRFLNDLRTRCEVPRVPFMADDLGVYIQRSKEYDALIDLLLDTDRDEPKAITSALALKGAGGYGKTTLARAICHDERIQEAFDDGILWVTLGESATYDTVREQLESLIFALSGERANAPTLEAAKTRLRELLADRDILLVIDDVWNADYVRPFLEGGERVARLITTRMGDTLPKGTRPISVNQMTGDEAFALIAYGLPADQADAQRDELARMAARLGEYPLLLKLTNGNLHDRMHDGEPLEKALDYLKRAFDKRGITKAVQVDNSTDRNRAVDASLSLSLERLNAQRREWFTRLAIFPEDATIPFATLEKAWDCDDLDVEETCAALNRLSLLLSYNLQTHSIALHNVIRAYLREQLIGDADKLKEMNTKFLDRYNVSFWRDLSDDEPYLWTRLAYHLLEARQGDLLIETIFDLRYLARKTILSGTYAIESDIETAETYIQGSVQPITYISIPNSDTVIGKYPVTTGQYQVYQISVLARSYRNMAHILNQCKSMNDVLVTLLARLSHLEALKSACDVVDSELKPRIAPYHLLPDLPHSALVRTLTGHTRWVNSVMYSPDGVHIVSASDDKMLKVWDAETGAQVRTLTGHSDEVTSASYSPDALRFVSTSMDKTLKVWDAHTGAEHFTLIGHTGGINFAAYSPDGRWIVSASYDTTLKVWDAQKGTERFTLIGHNGIVYSAAYSPDGRWIVSASYDTTLKVWDAQTGTQVRTLSGHSESVNSAAYSPDGRWIVSTSFDKTIKVWDAQTGAQVQTLSGHSESVNNATYSPDGRWIISTSRDHTLKVWDAETGAQVQTLSGHTNWVNSASFSSDGRWIVSGSSDSTLKVWEGPTPLFHLLQAQLGNETHTSCEHSATVMDIMYSPNGQHVVSASKDNSAKVWETDSGAILLTFSRHSQSLNSAAYSPDGRHVVSASCDNTLHVWEEVSGNEAFTITIPRREGIIELSPDESIVLMFDGNFMAVYSPDGRQIVSASDDKILRVWDAYSGTLLHAFLVPGGLVKGIAYSPDGRQIVSASDDKMLRVWDAQTGVEHFTLTGHNGIVNCVAYSPDGTRIASASYDGTLKVWDAERGSLVVTLSGHKRGVTSVRYCLGGTHIVSTSYDKTLKVWDAETGECYATFYGDASLYCCAWSPDEKHIVAGGDNGYIYWLRWVE